MSKKPARLSGRVFCAAAAAALLVLACLVASAPACPVTLVRVGYIDLESIIQTYAVKYMNAEIESRTSLAMRLQANYAANQVRMSETEKTEAMRKIREQRDLIAMLKNNLSYWTSKGDVLDEIIFNIVKRDIIEAIKKTSEIEGFNLVLDKTGNFVYGSEDINLTDKVLFRLDERLLDLQSKPPLPTLELELEESTRAVTGETLD
jgi:Skp family chaperone for outer membrane proteins